MSRRIVGKVGDLEQTPEVVEVAVKITGDEDFGCPL